jgi:hypothetical protein
MVGRYEHSLDALEEITADQRLVLALVHARREAWSVSLPRLLEHPLPDFLAQVVDVVLRHQDLDPVQELVCRTGFRTDDDVLLDEVDVDAQFVDEYPVLDVSIEAVGLLDEVRR